MKIATTKMNELFMQYGNITINLSNLNIVDDMYSCREQNLKRVQDIKKDYERLSSQLNDNRFLLANKRTKTFVNLLSKTLSHRINSVNVVITLLERVGNTADIPYFTDENLKAAALDKQIGELIRG